MGCEERARLRNVKKIIMYNVWFKSVVDHPPPGTISLYFRNKREIPGGRRCLMREIPGGGGLLYMKSRGAGRRLGVKFPLPPGGGWLTADLNHTLLILR